VGAFRPARTAAWHVSKKGCIFFKISEAKRLKKTLMIVDGDISQPSQGWLAAPGIKGEPHQRGKVGETRERELKALPLGRGPPAAPDRGRPAGGFVF
jgi:hypothetical protein